MRDIDLTTGAIPGHFRTVAVPAIFGMVFSTLYNVVDVWFAGLISTQAQAGLAIGFQAFFVTMAVGFGLGSAMSALVGNASGRGDRSEARRLAAQGISYAAIVSVTLMLASFWFGPELIKLVSEPGGYRDAATRYFRFLAFALPGFLLAFGANGILQARGDTQSMQRALMVAFFANIGLNPLFMFGIPGVWNGLGFNGIALATVVSQTGVALYVVFQVLRRDMMRDATRAEFTPNRVDTIQITTQMLPTSSAIMIMFISGFVVQFALKGFGEQALAAYGVALRIEQLLLLPVLGMTGALLPIAAQNFGAGHPTRVREATWFCWKLGFAMTIVASPLLWFGGESAMRVFTSDAEVIAIGASYLRVDSLLFPVYMMLFSINSLLQALKRPIWTMWISLYRQGIAIALFIWLFVAVLGFDVWGVWFGIATAVTSGLLVALIVVDRVAKAEIGGLLAKRTAPQ